MFGAVGLAIGMLITGSLNTISNQFMDLVHSEGISSPSDFWSKSEQGNGPYSPTPSFNHPFVQAVFMFIGEASCMLLFLVKNYRDSRRNPATAWKNEHGWKATFCYMFTASCDMTATGIMYAGLALSSASVYQMLRGSIVIFTFLISVIWLKRRFFKFHWASIVVVVVGVTIVGLQSIMHKPADGTSQSGVALGIVLIFIAQVIQAVQVTVQEKLLSMYDTPPLRLVGLEGIFGFLMLGSCLLPMYYIKIEGYPIENALDAWVQIENSPSELPTGHPDWHWPVGNALIVSIMGNIFSIAFFNVFGTYITKVLSCSHRLVIDSMRTLLVWMVALVLGWESFHMLQLVGFVIMLFGTATFNEYIRLPLLFTYEVPLRDAREMPLKEEDDAQISHPGRRERALSAGSAGGA